MAGVAGVAGVTGRLPPQYPQQKYYQPMLATANDFIAQQQALQTSVNQLANQQMPGFGLGLGLSAPLQSSLGTNLGLQQQNINLATQNLALNQNLMSQNLGQNLGLAGQNLGLSGQNLINSQNLALSGQNLTLSGQNLGLMGQNLGQLVAHRAVHHALARRAVDMEMAGMTSVNSTGSSQPSTPNKAQSYNEYMITLQHKLASISNSGPVSPQSPLEYSPALSPTQRPLNALQALHALHKAEGCDVMDVSEGKRSVGQHVAQLADLDHELSKISLHYKHDQPKDVFSEHSADEHDILAGNISDNSANVYEDAKNVGAGAGGVGACGGGRGAGAAGGGARYRVARAQPCRGYALCRLLHHHHHHQHQHHQHQHQHQHQHHAHVKDKLDMVSRTETSESVGTGEVAEGEGGEEELSCGDNNSSCSDSAADTYIITDSARATTYLLTDALADTIATIIDPSRSPPPPATQSEQTKPSPDRPAEDHERSYLIVDPARDMTCTVIDGTLNLEEDQTFSAFVEGKYSTEAADRSQTEATESVSASEELSRWRHVEEPERTWRDGGLYPLVRGGLAAHVVVDETLTDRAVCRQVVLLSLQPAPAQL